MEELLRTINDIQPMAPSFGAMIALILSGFLLFLSGYASGSEIAFFSLSPADLSELEEEKTERDRQILQLREESERTLATILITNNLVNVTIIMLLNYFFSQVIDFGKAYWIEFICLTVILTFLLLLFGEIMPKIYTRQQPLRFCRTVVGGILFFRKLFYPLSTILIKSGIIANKVMQKENHVLSVDDLEQALELTDKEDIKDEQRMLEGIVRFGDETAKEIMTSRQDVVDIDFKSSFSEVLKCIVENNYSRIPVYQDNSDNIRGILYIKDLLPHLRKPATFRWQSLIRPRISFLRLRRLMTSCVSSRRTRCILPLSSTSSAAPAVLSPWRISWRRLWGRSTTSMTRMRRVMSASTTTPSFSKERRC